MALPVDPNIAIPTRIPDLDGFSIAFIDASRWNDPVLDGSTTVGMAGNDCLNIINTGTGMAGISYLSTNFTLGKIWRISADMRITSLTGSHGELSLVLWKDADNYVKWGPYKTDGGTNTNAYIRAVINGVSQLSLSLCSDDIDTANDHTYTLVVLNNSVIIYYDGVYIAPFRFPELIDYEIRIEGGTWSDTDVIDARCNDIEIINDFDILQMTIGLMCEEIGTMVTDVYSRIPGMEADLTNIITAMPGIESDLDHIIADMPGIKSDLDSVIATLTSIPGMESDLNTIMLSYAGMVSNVSSVAAAMPGIEADLDSIIASLAGGVGGGTPVPFTGTLTLPDTTPVALEFTTATYGDQFHVNLMADMGGASLDYCYLYDASAGTYDDLSADANTLQTSTIPFVPETGAGQGDCIYFGNTVRFTRLDVYMEDGVFNRDNIFVWEYWNGAVWVALTATDGTLYNSKVFGKSGKVTFTDVISQTIVGGVLPNAYYIRARVTAAGNGLPVGTHLQCSEVGAEGFDSLSEFLGVMYVKIYRKIGGSYSALPSDVMPFTQCILDRNVDIGSFECWSDTKIVFSLSATPSATVSVPYAGYVLQL